MKVPAALAHTADSVRQIVTTLRTPPPRTTTAVRRPREAEDAAATGRGDPREAWRSRRGAVVGIALVVVLVAAMAFYAYGL